MEWIKFKVKKPKTNTIILVFTKDGRTIAGVYRNRKCLAYNPFNEELDVIDLPTHWMPVPEPPKK